MTTTVRKSAIILAMLLLISCGYSFSPGGEYIDQGMKTVYVEPFVNKTSEANVENVMRAAFINWFIAGNRFKVVDQADMADTIWRGSVNMLTTTALSFRTSNLAAEERMIFRLSGLSHHGSHEYGKRS
jgi:hypothetical protein